MSADTDTTGSAAPDAAAAPLDLLLTDAAIGMLRRVNPGGSGLRLATALASRPGLVAGRGRRLAGELARIAVGTSRLQPSRRDRRFSDPAWAGNPLLRRAMQAYLAATETAEGAVAEADLEARYQVATQTTEDPQEWLRLAETCHGSWWPDYTGWLAGRCGEEKAAPAEPGGSGLVPICDAPGTDVYDH